MASTIQLKSFTAKTTPVLADIIYMADSANSFDEVKVTLSDLYAAFPASVLLTPAGSQTITVGNLQTSAGSMRSGSATGGFAGEFAAFSPTSGKGNLQLLAADNGANIAVKITNASMGQNTIFTLPDPAAANTSFLLTTAEATQHITPFSLQADLGSFITGQSTGGVNNGFIAFSPTASSGSLQLLAANNAGNFNITLTNDSFAQASTIKVPDPGAVSAKFLLDTSASGKTLNYQMTLPSLAFNSTNGLIGTTTNDSAAAGSVGEYISATKSFGVPVSLTSDTPADVISISLNAGDWDIWGNVGFLGGATTLVQYCQGWSSQTSATNPGQNLLNSVPYSGGGTAVFAATNLIFNIPMLRISLASPTTIYLSVQAGFSVSTCSAFGNINARRVR